MTGYRRRDFLRTTAFALAASQGLGCAHTAAARAPSDTDDSELSFGSAQPFSMAALIERAKVRASRPYAPPPRPAPDIVQRIDYDAHGKMHYRRDHALYAEQGAYPVTFFPLGQYFAYSIRMFEVEGEQARELRYSPDYFDMPKGHLAYGLPKDAGFAGFRLHESNARSDWKTQDWMAFLGASYFRAIGELGQYGLSARGVAVNTSASVPEEFPLFTEFYIERATTPEVPVRICALLDGPRVSGAYEFMCHRERGVITDVDAHLFAREDIEQLGVGVLTSMYWYSQKDRPDGVDWRPEVHDSDGLAIWNGRGERLFRPINNPSRVVTSSFVDASPKGFGLLQRDRDVENYLDGVNYQRRPSVWIEPKGDWGEGEVQLVEIPTDDETNDNVVAFWHPKGPVRAGSELRYRYRLHWVAEDPTQPDALMRVSATRIGRGGEPGQDAPEGVTRFVVEFEGSARPTRPAAELPEAQLHVSRGEVLLSRVEHVPYTPRLRVVFDLALTGEQPAELRLLLRAEGDSMPLSETWLYQFDPSALG